jgi:hypothetical protein
MHSHKRYYGNRGSKRTLFDTMKNLNSIGNPNILLFAPITARLGWVMRRASSRVNAHCCRADSSWLKNVSASATC